MNDFTDAIISAEAESTSASSTEQIDQATDTREIQETSEEVAEESDQQVVETETEEAPAVWKEGDPLHLMPGFKDLPPEMKKYMREMYSANHLNEEKVEEDSPEEEQETEQPQSSSNATQTDQSEFDVLLENLRKDLPLELPEIKYGKDEEGNDVVLENPYESMTQQEYFLLIEKNLLKRMDLIQGKQETERRAQQEQQIAQRRADAVEIAKVFGDDDAALEAGLAFIKSERAKGKKAPVAEIAQIFKDFVYKKGDAATVTASNSKTSEKFVRKGEGDSATTGSASYNGSFLPFLKK